MKTLIQNAHKHPLKWVAASAAAGLVLSACGMQPSVAPTTVVSTPETATVPGEQATTQITVEASPSVESTTEAAVTPETAATVTTIPESEQGTAIPQQVTLSGPNVSYNGIAFDVGDSPFPSITVASGPVNQLFDITSVGLADASSNPTGTLFTLNSGEVLTDSRNEDPALVTARILVVDISDITKNAVRPMAGSPPTTDTTNGTQVMTDTVMAPHTMTSMAGMMDAIGFMKALSAVLESATPVPTSAISGSLVLTNSWLTQSGDDRVMLFQSNGKVIEFPGGKGVRFVAALNRRNSPLESDSLYYVFHGLTNDRLAYVSAMMPVQSDVFVTTAVSTPIPFPLDDTEGRTTYFTEILRLLDSPDANVNGAEFQASLQAFDAILGSLSVNPE